MRASYIVFAGALLLVASPAAAQTSATAASESDQAGALAAFNRGVEQYDHHDYHAALESFRTSYRLSPSPNSRLYIARCLRETGDMSGAQTEFQGTVDEATARAATEARYVPTRDAAQAEMTEFQARLGRIRVDVATLPSDARVRIDGRDVSREALARPVYVSPGHISITIEASGYAPYSSTIETTANTDTPVHPVLVSSSGGGGGGGSETGIGARFRNANPVYRNLGLAVAGLGVVGFVGLIAFGVTSSNIYHDVMVRCGGGPCGEADRGTVQTGQTMDTLANVSLGVGIVGILAGGALIFWSIRTGSRNQVTVGSSGTSIVVGGRF